MKQMTMTDTDGDVLHAHRDGGEVWLECQEVVGGEPLNVVGVGPLTPGQVSELRSVIGAAPRTLQAARALCWLTAAAGPAAWFAGATWGQVLGPWSGAGVMAAVGTFVLLHAGD